MIYNIKPFKTYRFNSLPIYFIATLALGLVSTLLGIGGGPINVSLLMLLFGLSIKEATIYSIVTIFFSQLSTLTTTFVTVGTDQFDLSYLMSIIPAAVIGGYVGSVFNKRLSDSVVSRVFLSVTFLVIGLNLINGILLFL
ncbi:sulfite exporter TauE/SafE family protein [Macrococcus hajekii]|uniref:sulfite exporter TauE/SafE family protein n=1 Tax=Macrococcus hajekii TaxID=198482 RepID=UPI0035715306